MVGVLSRLTTSLAARSSVLSLTDDRLCPGCSAARSAWEYREIWLWHVALRAALLIRDRPELRARCGKLGVLGGPVSAAHHCASLRDATQSSLRRLRKL